MMDVGVVSRKTGHDTIEAPRSSKTSQLRKVILKRLTNSHSRASPSTAHHNNSSTAQRRTSRRYALYVESQAMRLIDCSRFHRYRLQGSPGGCVAEACTAARRGGNALCGLWAIYLRRRLIRGGMGWGYFGWHYWTMAEIYLRSRCDFISTFTCLEMIPFVKWLG